MRFLSRSRRLLLITALLFTTENGQSSQTPANEFPYVMAADSVRVPGPSVETWDDLRQIIVSNGITNIDDLLAHLPDAYTNGFTLIYRTRALHEELVSAQRPRVLLFGKDAKFVLAYNSHWDGGRAKAGEIESIETLAYDDKTGDSYLRELVFDGGVPDFSKVETNPQSCLACHGQSPKGPLSASGHTVRGLWDPYNSWAGAYGSLSREGIDFIKIGSTEYENFQEFLSEKSKNPRYSYLKLRPQKMSELPLSAFISAPFSPNTMNDGLTFADGYSTLPNQILGMYLADYNFKRVGNILADESVQTRAAFQYLIKGISLDESFAKPDIDANTNPTDVTKKAPTCLAKIATFLPDTLTKVPFDQFGRTLLHKLREDYIVRKEAVEADNMGLSKLGAGRDTSDPYDENRAPRGLQFDSVNTPTHFHLLDPKNPGLTGNAALFYVLYLMDIPSQDISTAVDRGTNILVDGGYVLAGSTNLYYGDSSRCYTPEGMIKSTVIPYDIKHYCFSEPVEEFFTQYLPPRFFQDQGQQLDPNLDKMSCDELAAKSRVALKAYFH